MLEFMATQPNHDRPILVLDDPLVDWCIPSEMDKYCEGVHRGVKMTDPKCPGAFPHHHHDSRCFSKEFLEYEGREPFEFHTIHPHKGTFSA